MKNILLKLARGENTFDCNWRGDPRKCEILKVDLILNQVYVRFDRPVIVTQSRLVEGQFGGEDSFEDFEGLSSEEWLSI